MARLTTIPVLVAKNVDQEAKEWAEDSAKAAWGGMFVPVIVNLDTGELDFQKHAPFIGRIAYHHVRAFIERYLVTEAMRGIERTE